MAVGGAARKPYPMIRGKRIRDYKYTDFPRSADELARRASGSKASLQQVLDNIGVAMAQLQSFTVAGMTQGIFMIAGDALEMTPERTGELRHSQKRDVDDSNPGQIIGTITYTAPYAPYVHEIDKNYVAPGTHWKFLQIALQQDADAFMQILAASGRAALA